MSSRAGHRPFSRFRCSPVQCSYPQEPSGCTVSFRSYIIYGLIHVRLRCLWLIQLAQVDIEVDFGFKPVEANRRRVSSIGRTDFSFAHQIVNPAVRQVLMAVSVSIPVLDSTNDAGSGTGRDSGSGSSDFSGSCRDFCPPAR